MHSNGVLERISVRMVDEFNLINKIRLQNNQNKLKWQDFTDLIVRHIRWAEMKGDIALMEKNHE